MIYGLSQVAQPDFLIDLLFWPYEVKETKPSPC
jgi:hypothetical protein